MRSFEKELETLLNCHSKDNDTNTPDFLLAEFLTKCLQAYKDMNDKNDIWHGRRRDDTETLDNGLR